MKKQSTLTNKQTYWRGMWWSSFFNAFLPLIGLIIAITFGTKLIQRKMMGAGVYMIVASVFIFIVNLAVGTGIGIIMHVQHQLNTAVIDMSLMFSFALFILQLLCALIVNIFVKNEEV